MKKYLSTYFQILLLALGFLVLSTGCNKHEPLNNSNIDDLPDLDVMMAKPTAGRFQILFSPIIRQDTFLLDTVNGRVWVLVKEAKGGGVAWQSMKTEGL